MIKILFVIPNLLGGGAEKVLVNLVNNLNTQKYQVTVMTIFDVGENKKYLKENIHYRRIFKKIIRGNVHIFKIFSPSFLAKSLVVDNQYDIIVSYLQSPATRIVSGYKGNAKIVNWVHNEYKTLDKPLKIYRNLKELVDCYNNYDATIFVSETAKKAFEYLFPDITCEKKVLYNTIEDQNIRKLSLDENEVIEFNGEYINLISVGRFVEQKAFDRLIRIMNKLVNYENIKVRLYLLGKGPLESYYKKLISDFKLQNKVMLLGYKENPYKYVRKADLFVCSSLYEGFSTAVTEALILGVPVITTLCSGMEELLGRNNEYGVIVKNNEEALFSELNRIIKNEKEMGIIKQKAALRSEEFKLEKTLEKTEYFFESLLKGENYDL